MFKNKKDALIAVLVVALILVTYLWITERRSSDPIKNVALELGERADRVDTACADLTTEARQTLCSEALGELEVFLTQLRGLAQ